MAAVIESHGVVPRPVGRATRRHGVGHERHPRIAARFRLPRDRLQSISERHRRTGRSVRRHPLRDQRHVQRLVLDPHDREWRDQLPLDISPFHAGQPAPGGWIHQLDGPSAGQLGRLARQEHCRSGRAGHRTTEIHRQLDRHERHVHPRHDRRQPLFREDRGSIRFHELLLPVGRDGLGIPNRRRSIPPYRG